MKRIRDGLTAVILGGALVALAVPAVAQDVVLRYSNWLPSGYPLHERAMKPWLEDIEKVTEGRVKVTISPKVVGTVPGQYDVAADGLADITLFLPGYTPGRFPLMDGLDLPFMGNNTAERCPATWRAYEKFIAPLGEFEEVKALSVYCANSGQIAMVEDRIETMEDMAGKKIRSPSDAISQALTSMEATPVSKPASELYELANGGVIDGAIFPLDSVVGFNLQGVLKTVTYMPGGFNNSMVLIAMNPAAWDRISEADQAAIMDISGEALAARVGNMLTETLAEACETLTSNGVEIYEPDQALVDAMEAAAAPAREDWIERAKAAGMEDPQAMIDYMAQEVSG
ncbi:MAG: TRAP transporter substrate-binding protein [Pseudomonadota bacterium]|nr:TRAP transporter substrate-binding protein [Pseudomonadota bacterium]